MPKKMIKIKTVDHILSIGPIKVTGYFGMSEDVINSVDGFIIVWVHEKPNIELLQAYRSIWDNRVFFIVDDKVTVEYLYENFEHILCRFTEHMENTVSSKNKLPN
jgi:hypothetical protein